MKVLKLMSAVAACLSLSIFVFRSEASGQGPGQEAVVPDPKPPGRIDYINPNPPTMLRLKSFRKYALRCGTPPTVSRLVISA